MNLNLIADKINKNEFAQNFIKELGNELARNLHKNKNFIKGENMYNIKLTSEEQREFEKKKFNFLQDYLQENTYIVTDKYENDNEYHRYKVAKYKDNMECKYITFEQNLPQNVQIGDIVKKIGENYIHDKKATEYVKASINDIKKEIINNRK